MRRRLVKPRGCVIGLDLSLRAAAACSIPLPWPHDMKMVRTRKAGKSLAAGASAKERTERIVDIVEMVVGFCIDEHATVVAIEDYAYSAGGANATQLAELGGAVKVALYNRRGLVVEPIPAATARKILLQHVPRLGAGKTKPWVVRNVRRLGGLTTDWSDDECDAFVVANAALMRAGALAMSFPGE